MNGRGASLRRGTGVDGTDRQIVRRDRFAIQLLRSFYVPGLRVHLERLAYIPADDRIGELIVLRLDVLVDRSNGQHSRAVCRALGHRRVVRALKELWRIVAILDRDDHLCLVRVVAAYSTAVLRHHGQHHSVLRFTVQSPRDANYPGLGADGEAAIVRRADEQIVDLAVLARVLIGRLDKTDGRADIGALRHVHVEHWLNKLRVVLVHACHVHENGREADHLRIGVWIGGDDVQRVLVRLLVVETDQGRDLAGVLANAKVILARAAEDFVLDHRVLRGIDVSSDQLRLERAFIDMKFLQISFFLLLLYMMV